VTGMVRVSRTSGRSIGLAWLLAGWIAAGVMSAGPAAAHGYGTGDLQVRHPWARATPPGATVAAGYLEIRNSGQQPDRVVAASTPAAERVEFHIQMQEGEVLKMREVKDFPVPARQRLTLRPGGSHLMLVGMKQPLAKGGRVPLTLRFERAGELQIELEIQPIVSRKAHH
jgi:periplasmic copper chaperone A